MFVLSARAANPLFVVTELSPPAQTLVDGRVSGTVTQRVRDLLRRAGLEGQFHVFPWARAYELALVRPNTLIYAMARTPARESQFKWIAPVGRYSLGFMKLTRHTSLKLENAQQAKIYLTAVQRKDVAVEVLSDLGFREDDNLLLTADIQQSWELLLKGKVDFVIDDPAAIQDLLDKHNLSPEQVTFELMLPQLEQLTYLAASLETDDALVEKLRAAHLPL
ncbi:substrate-binding periplasmic protein [Bowmanella dokdonensis]